MRASVGSTPEATPSPPVHCCHWPAVMPVPWAAVPVSCIAAYVYALPFAPEPCPVEIEFTSWLVKPPFFVVHVVPPSGLVKTPPSLPAHSVVVVSPEVRCDAGLNASAWWSTWVYSTFDMTP